MKTFKVEIVSSEKMLYSGEATFVSATATTGELGIAAGHTQLLAKVKPGDIRIQHADGSEDIFYVSGGLMEVQPTAVSILSDTAVRAADLNEAAILEAKEAAEAMLANNTSELEYARALSDLAKAAAQLQALNKWRKRVK